MARTDNYLIQAQQAKSCFLTYDAEALAKKAERKAGRGFSIHHIFRPELPGLPENRGYPAAGKRRVAGRKQL